MTLTHLKNVFFIALTFVVAFMLSVLPLPDWAVWYRPAWVPLVLIYWIFMLPNRISIGIAWCIGLLLDALNGTLLGQHALSLIVVAYFVANFQTHIRLYSVWQQAVYVGFLVFIYQAIQLWIQGILGGQPRLWLFLLAALTSMVLWPWMRAILYDFQTRTKVA